MSPRKILNAILYALGALLCCPEKCCDGAVQVQVEDEETDEVNNMEINLAQAKKLVECFGGDEDSTLTLIEGDEASHSGPGLYTHDEYPEHGCSFLGKGGD